eukprot:4188963-Amphidinium_carterae.1
MQQRRNIQASVDSVTESWTRCAENQKCTSVKPPGCQIYLCFAFMFSNALRTTEPQLKGYTMNANTKPHW